MGFFSRREVPGSGTPGFVTDILKDIGAGKSFEDLNLKFTEPEKTAERDILAPFLKLPPTSDLFREGEDVLSNILKGTTDPSKDPRFLAQKEISKTNLQEVFDLIGRTQAAGGKFFTSETGAAKTRESGKVAQNLDRLIADIMAEEQERKFRALPEVRAFESARLATPLKQLAAAGVHGDIIRNIEAKNYEANYTNFRDTQTQRLQSAELGLKVKGPQFGASPFEDIMDTLSQGAGLISGLGGIGGIAGGIGNLFGDIGSMFGSGGSSERTASILKRMSR